MPFPVDALMEAARRRTRIDLDDPQAREPLGVLVTSLDRDAHLSADGRVQMEARLVRILSNRLRMERDLRAHPEIAEQRVIAPVFVFGLPRSGTTKLQKLLSATGDFTALPLWMAHNPSLISGERGEIREPRIRDTDDYVQWIDRVSPKARLVHAFDTHEPEEVNPILEQGFRSVYLPAFVEVPGFIGWTIAQPPHLQLEYLRRVLQYLQWQFDVDPGKPWVLKNPTFLGMEPVIRQVFPDATLVVTHRHPTAIIPSSASLVVQFHKLYSDVDVARSAGPMMVEGQSAATLQHLANRTSSGGPEVVDVGYGELMRSSAGVVERVHRHLGKPFVPGTRSRIEAWEASHGQHRMGVHRYAAEDYGLTDAGIAARFGDYIERFGALF